MSTTPKPTLEELLVAVVLTNGTVKLSHPPAGAYIEASDANIEYAMESNWTWTVQHSEHGYMMVRVTRAGFKAVDSA
jgi:hypothetical protein